MSLFRRPHARLFLAGIGLSLVLYGVGRPLGFASASNSLDDLAAELRSLLPANATEPYQVSGDLATTTSGIGKTEQHATTQGTFVPPATLPSLPSLPSLGPGTFQPPGHPIDYLGNGGEQFLNDTCKLCPDQQPAPPDTPPEQPAPPDTP
ncbi:MAG: hypothetical protein KM296_09655, partial [Brockia lithotrophica]|nr:hypothetical protein [Brockia lithotrophica]